eukprot:jgi/Mesvir1/24929/Mv16908-RA.2
MRPCMIRVCASLANYLPYRSVCIPAGLRKSLNRASIFSCCRRQAIHPIHVFAEFRSPSSASTKGPSTLYSTLQAEIMALLDKAQFVSTLSLNALRIPKERCSAMMKLLKGHTLDLPRVKTVVNDPDNADCRLLLLATDMERAGKGAPPPPPEVPPFVKEVAEREQLPLVQHVLTLDFDYWSADYILRQLLPEGVEVPSSFETIGHVAHVNLRDELLPFKQLIGQVLLLKNQPRIRSVVNKVSSIENEFRVPQIELLAGDADLEAEVKQYGATFRVNFAEVYWNSRLDREHARLVELFAEGETICDMFAGVGPFAIPAALAGCVVYANDLNPRSVDYLVQNASINKVAPYVHAYNMDARAFVRSLLRLPGAVPLEERTMPDGAGKGGGDSKEKKGAAGGKAKPGSPGGGKEGNGGATAATMEGRPSGGPTMSAVAGSDGATTAPLFQHVVMNLPASAIEFLDVFRGAFQQEAWRGRLPTVHCYCFARAEEMETQVWGRAAKAMGMDDASALKGNFHNVRNVAPNKDMICLSFALPESVAFAAVEAGECGNAQKPSDEAVHGSMAEGILMSDKSPASKRPKTES